MCKETSCGANPTPSANFKVNKIFIENDCCLKKMKRDENGALRKVALWQVFSEWRDSK